MEQRKVKCRKIKRRLSVFIDGEATPELEGKIRDHIKSCSMCRREMEELERIWNLIENVSVPEPLPHYYTRLRANIRSNVRPRWRFKWEEVLVPVTTVAVMAFGIFLGTLLLKNHDQLALESLSNGSEELTYLYLDTFDDFPDASLVGIYFNNGEQENNKEAYIQ